MIHSRHAEPVQLTPARLGYRSRILATLGALALTACSEITAPVTPPRDAPPQTAAVREIEPAPVASGPLGIGVMLEDPLFQAMALGIDEPSVAGPLRTALDALGSAQTGRAVGLIAKAMREIEGLEDDPSAVETVIRWSIIERFLEAADLL